MAKLVDDSFYSSRCLSAATITPPRSAASSPDPTPATPPPRAILSISKPKPSPTAARVERLFSTLRAALAPPPLVQHPTTIRNVSPTTYSAFYRKYARHPFFSRAKFEYDPMRAKLIHVALPTPFHDVAQTIMNDHIIAMVLSSFDTPARIRSIRCNRENLSKSTPSGLSSREPDCALWNAKYHSGVVPTLVWEVGHTQSASSLLRRAKMWCRRYNGLVRVVILIKYLRKDPRRDMASVLTVFRPVRKDDGRWTAAQQGPVYVLFPRPEAAGGVEDAVRLGYQDYFGTRREGAGQEWFDLPLESVREKIEEMVAVTIARGEWRYVSGGSSVGGMVQEGGRGQAEMEMEMEGRVSPEGRESPEVEEVPYEDFGEDWDAAMSDVSDEP